MALIAKFTVYLLVVLVVIGTGSVIAYIIGLLGGFNIPHLNLLNSVYYTIDTLTTNSYGDIVPVSSVAKAFTIVTEITGVSIFVGALTILTSEIMDRKMNKITGEISDVESRLLKNHVVLIGTDSVNVYLAEQLKSEKKRFVIITNDRAHLEEFRDSNYPLHVANITSKESLKRYGVPFAEKVVIDVHDKSLSMYSFMVARSIAGKNTKIKIIARDQETEEYFSEIAQGPNEQVINPESTVAKEIIGKI